METVTNIHGNSYKTVRLTDKNFTYYHGQRQAFSWGM
jgi:hypothetical protein